MFVAAIGDGRFGDVDVDAGEEVQEEVLLLFDKSSGFFCCFGDAPVFRSFRGEKTRQPARKPTAIPQRIKTIGF